MEARLAMREKRGVKRRKGGFQTVHSTHELMTTPGLVFRALLQVISLESLMPLRIC